MKKIEILKRKRMSIIIINVLFLICSTTQAQDLISGGTNSWIFHTPENRTSLYIAPKVDGNWHWIKQTKFQIDGSIDFSNQLNIGTGHGVKLGVDNGNWKKQTILWTGYDSSNGDWTELRVPGAATNSAILRLTQKGNVGIGTSNPSGRFEILKDADISSSLTLSNSAFVLRANNDGNDASLRFGVDNTNLKAVIQTQQTTTAAKFDLLFNPFGGNVGIGTTDTQNFKLAVAGNTAIDGTLKAKEIKVQANVWADFVFAPNYKLRPLAEVETFIKENQHLPEIPSEAEVKEEGIAVGEMNAKLLQKIEELTLYVIEQNKRLESVEKENQQIKIKNQNLEKQIQEIKK